MTSAIYTLGEWLVNHSVSSLERTEGEKWLTQSFKQGSGEAGSTLGRYYYLIGKKNKAAEVLLRSFELTGGIAGNNLAYMVRHSEVPEHLVVPAINKLLEEGLQDHDTYCLINWALCQAQGVQTVQDWHGADRTISSISKEADEKLHSLGGIKS